MMNFDQIQLSDNALTDYLKGDTRKKALVQITDLKAIENRQCDEGNLVHYRITIADATSTCSSCILNTDLNHLVESALIKANTLIYIKDIALDMVDDNTNRSMLIINDVDIVQTNSGTIDHNSRNAELYQQSNVQMTSHVLQSLSTINRNIVQPKSSSTNYFDAKRHNDESILKPSDHAMPIAIAQINQYNNGWSIKGIVTNKSNVHHYKNSRGEGTLFSFDLQDSTGEIQITAFNNECSRLFSIIEIGQVYVLANASVKPANQQYNKLSSIYEIIATSQTSVSHTSIDDFIHVPISKYNFIRLNEIAMQQSDAYLDVIGIVNLVCDPTMVTNKTHKKSYPTRIISILDETGSISVTLWQDHARDFNDKSNPVIAFKAIKVHDFNGCRSLSTTSKTNLKINSLDTERTEHLKRWFHEQHPDTRKIANSNIIQVSTQQASIKTFTEAIIEYVSNQSKTIYFSIKGICTEVDKHSFIYKMCPVDTCTKKVIEISDTQYRCVKCDKTYDVFKWGYKTTIQVTDNSITQPVIIFNKQAEALFGIPAAEMLTHMMNNNNNVFDSITSKIINHEYYFKLCVKSDKYKMIGRVTAKISHLFHDEHEITENFQHKRSMNAISPETPIKPNIILNGIDHDILINTCRSLKKMKLDINEHKNIGKIEQIDPDHKIDFEEEHFFQQSELYQASFVY
ncbi:unnamed protein product [Rotaria socialis]|uniref:Replication protein A subunit n=1 Tax=Rotaria socialis TaxID=392032 RepID=A0A820M2J8_9BILA|nr:unnamed protein product [Rotaria socialis]